MKHAIELLQTKILSNKHEILAYFKNYPKESKQDGTWQADNILYHQKLIKSYSEALNILKGASKRSSNVVENEQSKKFCSIEFNEQSKSNCIFYRELKSCKGCTNYRAK